MAPLTFSDSSFGLYSSPSSSDGEVDEVNPTRLLSLAIRKRRVAYSRKERDLREELMHTGLIQSLCKYLGEGRARRRKHRRSKHNRRRSLSSSSAASTPTPAVVSRLERKREWSDNEKENVIEEQPESRTVELAALNGTQQDLIKSSFVAATDNVDLMMQPNIVQHHSLANDERSVTMEQQQLEELNKEQQQRVTPPPAKMQRCDDPDPFGLDALFAEFYGCIKTSSGCYQRNTEEAVNTHGVQPMDYRSSVPSVA